MKRKEIKVAIQGMTCEDCPEKIERLLRRNPGVLDVQINYVQDNGNVAFDSDNITETHVIDAVNSNSKYRLTLLETVSSNSEKKFDLIIIGAGSAAFAAAIRANELGLKTLMVNDGLPIGGTCVNVGCLPSKHLIRVAENIYKASHSLFAGVHPNKPDWNYSSIILKKKELVAQMQKLKYTDLLEEMELVHFLNGRAELSGKNSILVKNETYTGLKIIVATGSTSAIPPIPGIENVNYYTNDTLFDLEELPESLTIVGGGYIGLEIAQTYQRFGCKVRIVEYFDRILFTEVADITDELRVVFENEEIEIFTGVNAINVYEKNGRVILDGIQNEKPVSFESTHLLMATGRKPNTRGMGLEQIGIELLKSGHVKVNEWMETNIPNIYAIGDCNQFPPFVYTAAYEGKAAVDNAFGSKRRSVDYSAMPWVIFTDPQVAGVGMDEKQLTEKGIPFEVSTLPMSEVPRSQVALESRGFIKLIRNPETDLLLGARIIAPEAGEMIMELSLAIKYGITIDELINSFHPYLTYSEGIKLAAITFNKNVKHLSCCAT